MNKFWTLLALVSCLVQLGLKVKIGLNQIQLATCISHKEDVLFAEEIFLSSFYQGLDSHTHHSILYGNIQKCPTDLAGIYPLNIRAWAHLIILFCMTDMKKSPTGPACICLLKVTIETLKHGVKYVQI